MVTETKPKQETWQYSGKVVSVNENGLKLDAWQDGREWLNFTREEWRGNWYTPQRGEEVTVQCVAGKDGKMWVKSIVLDGPQDWSEPGKPPTGTPSTFKDLSIVRQVSIYAAANLAQAFIAQRCYIDPDGEPMTETVAIDVAAMAQTLERHMARE